MLAVTRSADAYHILNHRTWCLALEEVRRQPHRLPDVAAQLLGAQVVTGPQSASQAPGTAAPGERMELTRAGRTFAHLRRPGLPFSCDEAAEVQALARLADPSGEAERDDLRLVLRDGHEVTVRVARPRDQGFVRALQGSKSLPVLGTANTQAGERSGRGERRAESCRPLVTWVATGPLGERVAAAVLLPSSATEVGEVCVVVQDRWQQRGLGSALVLQSLVAARQRGLTRLSTLLHLSDRAMRRSFVEAGATLTRLESLPLIAVSLPTELPDVSVTCPQCSRTGRGPCEENSSSAR